MEGIAEQFAALQRDDPQRPLIFLPERNVTLTASDLWHQHQGFLSSLDKLRFHEGDLLVCGIGNRPELLAVLLASRVRGVTLLVVDTGATISELQALCTRFGAKALLMSTLVAPEERHTSGAPGLALLGCVGPTSTYSGAALLKLTSGTTGLAKAAWMTEAELLADGAQIMATMGILADETQLAAIPLGHSYGLGVVVMPLLLQGTAMILRESFNPQHLPVDAQRYGARRFPGVPFMFEYLVEHPPADGWPERLTQLISAGARLSPEAVRAFHGRFGLKVHSYYGTTETGGISYDESDDLDAATVGRPLSGVSISMRSEAGLPPGSGRVHVRSAAVCDGYVGIESSDFIEGGFLTGDYGRIGDDGRLTLGGRLSSFINVAGRKVQPDEVEAVLRNLPQVADARVIRAFDALRGEKVVAFLVARTGMAAPSDVEIRRYCSSQLAAYKIPRLVFFVDEIPLTARGKTDRGALDDLLRRESGRTV
jgi:long-chain acyl-CoA synthetase